jgi:hypothetical protein
MSEASAYEGLSDKRRNFVNNYVGVSNCCKTDAARRAGYRHPEQYGYQLYKDPLILAAIKERMEDSEATAAEVLMRLTRIARGALGMFIRRVKDPNEDPLTPEEEERLQDAREIRRAVVAENGEDEEADEERFAGFLPGDYGIDLAAVEEAGLLWMIEEIAYDKHGRLRVKVPSVLRANELLAQRHGLLKNQHIHTGLDGKPIQFQRETELDLSDMTDEELDAWKRYHERQRAKRSGG